MRKRLIFLIAILVSLLSVACSDSGDTNVPEFPEEPSDAVSHTVIPGYSSLHIDMFENPVYVDEALVLYGDNMRFVQYGECKGVGYINEIPREGWTLRSMPMRAGVGYLISELAADGCNMAALYVDSINSKGNAFVKTLSPQYGTFGRFAVNTKTINIGATQNDTLLYLIHPTTYTVALQNTEWMTALPNVTYIQLFFGNNDSGRERRNVIHLSNGVFDNVDIQVVQAP